MSAYTHQELEPELDEFPSDEFQVGAERQAEDSFEGGSRFDEMEEMELAAELLEVTDESELDQFLGKLLKNATRAVGGSLHSSLGSTLGSYLKGAIKKALPKVGGALGDFLVPGVGGDIGSQFASNAGRYFGLELEGLSAEDGEFEIARRLVRFGDAAARQAAETAAALTRSGANNAGQLAQTARGALLAAAREHAPGFIRAGADLIRGDQGSAAASSCHCGTHRQHHSGSWIRHGREIHLLGA